MNIVQIDIICLQTLQGSMKMFLDVVGIVTDGAVPCGRIEPKFGGEEDLGSKASLWEKHVMDYGG